MQFDVTFPGNKKVDARFKNFTICTDQPTLSGGDDSAPSPFDLFLASLATCSGYYVLAFCQGREINPQGVKVSLKCDRNPDTKMIDDLTIEIALPPEFPAKYETAVLKAVDQCAVKRHLHQPPKIQVVTVRS